MKLTGKLALDRAAQILRLLARKPFPTNARMHPWGREAPKYATDCRARLTLATLGAHWLSNTASKM